MTIRRLWGWTLCGCLLPVLGVGILQSLFFHRALLSQQNGSARMIAGAMGSIAAQALHSHDDLLLQQVIGGLSRAPGMTLACVLDPEKKILAHTLPGKIGLPFKNAPEWSLRSLSRDGKPVGTLALWVSEKRARRWESRQTQVLAALLLFQLLGSAGIAWLWSHSFERERKKSAQLQQTVLLGQENLLREQTRIRILQEKVSGWIVSALEQSDRPLLLLDESQRVAGLNTAARRWLDSSSSGPIVNGQHLLDIALLAAHLPALEESLKNPGHLLQLTQTPSTPRVQFLTLRAGSGDDPHTWVYLPLEGPRGH